MENETQAVLSDLAAHAHAAEDVPTGDGTCRRDENFLRRCLEEANPDTARLAIAQYTQRLIESTGRGMVLTGLDLSGRNLSFFDLRRANLNRTLLHGAQLDGVNLSGASMICPGIERTSFRGANLTNAYLHAMAAQVCDFTDADLSNVLDATGALFHGCKMERADLSGAVLSGTSLYQCNLEEARFVGSNLQGAMMNECFLDRTDFSNSAVAQFTITKSRMSGATFDHASGQSLVLQRLTGADGLVLDSARLPHLRIDGVSSAGLSARKLYAPDADVAYSQFPEANFEGSDLHGARWESCQLDRANMAGVILAGASFRSCSARDANLSSAHGENLCVVECVFVDATMSNFEGRCASFRDSNLQGVKLDGAYLYRAMLTGDPPKSMSLVNAVLVGSNLVQAYITADLTGADLRNAKCAYARMNQSSLAGADLAGVQLYQASLVKTDFTGAALAQLEAPFFTDRCPGLLEAIQAAQSTAQTKALEEFVLSMQALMLTARGGST